MPSGDFRSTDEAALVAVGNMAKKPIPEPPSRLRVVAVRGGFHLDDVRAEVRQHQPARRPHDHVGELDDPQPRQRRGQPSCWDQAWAPSCWDQALAPSWWDDARRRSRGAPECLGQPGFRHCAVQRLAGAARRPAGHGRPVSLSEVDPRGETHAFQQEHQILRDDVAGRARRDTGSRPGPPARQSKPRMPSSMPGQGVGQAQPHGVVQMQVVAACPPISARTSAHQCGGCAPGCA